MGVRSTLGFSFLVSLSSLFGGLPRCGGPPRRGEWEGARSRRPLHLTIPRSNMVSDSDRCVFHELIDDDCFPVTLRCTNMAIPLPYHGRCLSTHLHPLHRTRCHLCLTPRSFPVLSCLHLRPTVDNSEPTFRTSARPLSTVRFASLLVIVPAYATRSIGNPSLCVYYLL